MIDNETINKIIRKKVVWAEIKAKQQEYKRLQKQIDELEQAKKDVSFEVQKKLEESQNIAEWLDERDCEALLCYEEK
jgi:t-SNARE complex subunit (syntaxin)